MPSIFTYVGKLVVEVNPSGNVAAFGAGLNTQSGAKSKPNVAKLGAVYDMSSPNTIFVTQSLGSSKWTNLGLLMGVKMVYYTLGDANAVPNNAAVRTGTMGGTT